jgi:CBS domain-containing protein
MNIAFFLTPKHDVVWLSLMTTVRQALTTMQESGYTAVPLLDEGGRYAGTLSEGDLLRKITDSPQRTLEDIQMHLLQEVPLRIAVRAVGIDAEMEELFSRAVEQNFVPVVDSRNAFVGIVTRRAVIRYLAEKMAGRPLVDLA